MRRRGGQSGFTLIELMISLVLFSFVIAGVLAVAVSMATGFREQKVTIGAESSARAVMEFMGEAVRGVSPGVPTGAKVIVAGVSGGDIVDLDDDDGGPNCAQGALEVINSSVAPDELKLVFAYGQVATSSLTAMTEASTGGTLDVVNAGELAAGDMILVTDYQKGHLVKIQSVAGNVLTLFPWNCTPVVATFSYLPGAVVVRAARAHFFIAPLDLIPTLWMDPDAEGPQLAEPMAEGIEDLQVEVGVDGDALGVTDGIIDQWVFDVAGDTIPLGSPRAVRISLLARAVGRLTGTTTALPPQIGDRAPWGTADNFRRRALTSTIEIRNLEGSR